MDEKRQDFLERLGLELDSSDIDKIVAERNRRIELALALHQERSLVRRTMDGEGHDFDWVSPSDPRYCKMDFLDSPLQHLSEEARRASHEILKVVDRMEAICSGIGISQDLSLDAAEILEEQRPQRGWRDNPLMLNERKKVRKPRRKNRR